jgi:hypothetical protein
MAALSNAAEPCPTKSLLNFSPEPLCRPSRLAALARYPAPAVGLPAWRRFAAYGLLLRYIAGGDVSPLATNRLESGEVWKFF